jgi:hypothetical protein
VGQGKAKASPRGGGDSRGNDGGDGGDNDDSKAP